MDKLVRELVKKILTNHTAFKGQWTVQGFGMYRLYLENGLRMTLWHDNARRPGVSMLHTHPWDFASYVVCGAMHNQRFVETEEANTPMFMKSVIKAGEGGGLVGEPTPKRLKLETAETIYPGATYKQGFNEIHRSLPLDGTVTLCDRTVASPDGPDLALVYWEAGSEWGSAEPIPAEPFALSLAVSCALAQLQALEQ